MAKVNELLECGIEAARLAGALQRERYEDATLKVERKGRIDLVTEVDVACEKIIVEHISSSYPEHGILAEEGEANRKDEGFLWIIDPLDGTTNFAHGFPIFAVSIGVAVDGVVQAGVVYDPLRDEMFTATKDGGAFLNGNPIKVTDCERLEEALLATGFPYDIKTNPRNNINNFNRVALEAQAVRRPGAAAVDLVYTACGRLDGFWEQRLKPWDMAAGALIVEEAGGTVTDMAGKPLDLYGETVCATAPKIHAELLTLLDP